MSETRETALSDPKREKGDAYMTIEAAKDARNDLEDAIYTVVRQFELRTKLLVTGINVRRISTMQNGSPVVSVDVELPGRWDFEPGEGEEAADE